MRFGFSEHRRCGHQECNDGKDGGSKDDRCRRRSRTARRLIHCALRNPVTQKNSASSQQTHEDWNARKSVQFKTGGRWLSIKRSLTALASQVHIYGMSCVIHVERAPSETARRGSIWWIPIDGDRSLTINRNAVSTRFICYSCSHIDGSSWKNITINIVLRRKQYNLPVNEKTKLSEATLSRLLGEEALQEEPISAKTLGSVHPAPLYTMRGSSTAMETLTTPLRAGSFAEGNVWVYFGRTPV